MWTLFCGYIGLGLLVVIYGDLGEHLAKGFRILVCDYYNRPGFRTKFLALTLGIPAVFIGLGLVLGLYPLMLFTRMRASRLRKRDFYAPQRKLLKGFPPVYHN
jgi:hypothetical protein